MFWEFHVQQSPQWINAMNSSKFHPASGQYWAKGLLYSCEWWFVFECWLVVVLGGCSHSQNLYTDSGDNYVGHSRYSVGPGEYCISIFKGQEIECTVGGRNANSSVAVTASMEYGSKKSPITLQCRRTPCAMLGAWPFKEFLIISSTRQTADPTPLLAANTQFPTEQMSPLARVTYSYTASIPDWLIFVSAAGYSTPNRVSEIFFRDDFAPIVGTCVWRSEKSFDFF